MSTYCTRTQIEQTFGVKNVGVWSDLDNDQNAQTQATSITRAILVAGEIIDSHLSKTTYNFPLENLAGDTPTLIEEVAATLAGIWLYESRGDVAFDPQSGQPLHRYRGKMDWAYRMLNELRDGERVIETR